jgi:hypothetical protein
MNKKFNASLLMPVVIVLLAAPSISAKGDKVQKGAKHANKAAKHEPRHEAKHEAKYVIDRDGHRRIVTDYYSREGLPPGLAKRDSLPPGLAKQLRERGRLPPGLQKRLTPVPNALNRRFPPAAPYYARYFAGRDLVVIDSRTNQIVDVIPDVLPR